MNKDVNYYEKAKAVLVEVIRQNEYDNKYGLITRKEYNDTYQAIDIISSVVDAQYSKSVIHKRGLKVLVDQEYFDQVIDQLDIYLNHIIYSSIIGIKKEDIPSELSLQTVVNKLRTMD